MTFLLTAKDQQNREIKARLEQQKPEMKDSVSSLAQQVSLALSLSLGERLHEQSFESEDAYMVKKTNIFYMALNQAMRVLHLPPEV